MSHAISLPIAGTAAILAAVTGCVIPASQLPVPARLPGVTTLIRSAPADAGMRNDLNAALDSIMAVALQERVAPGAALAVGRYGRLVHMKAYGTLDTAKASPPVDESSMYDMASLTKVLATTTAAMMLEEQALLDLDRTVASYLPAFNAPDKAAITVRMLLMHRGGLEAFAPLYREFKGRDQYLQQINLRPLKSVPGTQTVYSDWDMILMQLVIETIAGTTLDAFVSARVFQPLGMTRTLFNPDTSLHARIAPTEIDSLRGGLVRGAVHDENAWAVGGVAGHAGLFSSLRDLAVFAQMLLNGGEYNGVRIAAPNSIARWTAPQWRGSSRALGWDTAAPGSSAGRHFSARSFGHTGFTGTSMWIDPERGLFVILLTNRVNPSRDNQRHVPLRKAVADAAQMAILDAPLIDWEGGR
ncbi:MAG: serine hydrolase [Gemmatimonadaceae bacterium]|nr:serine hydrolase [Gemmatimonadaceae bacterium]